MPWLQLRINTERERVPKVEDTLMALGALSVTLEDNADEPIFEPELGETPLWTETRVTALFEADIDTKVVLSNFIAATNETPSACQWQIVEDKDWQREWMEHFHPIQCGENFWICPSWTPAPNPDAINLMLDPGLAFGTGTHPTTFMCLEWIAKTDFQDKFVIDYGCGSGILGIGALLHNAKKVIGVDIDPQALVATRENIERNKLSQSDFPVVFPNKCPNEQVDIVLANILAGPLVELAPTLISLVKPGGKICLSGIIESQKQAIVAAYEQDVTIDEIRQQEEWLCVMGTRKPG